MTTCTAAVLLTITVVVDRYRTGTMMSLVHPRDTTGSQLQELVSGYATEQIWIK
jgi:hypothetical protein